MPTIADNRRWSGYDWRHRGDEWSEPWGTTPHLWHGTILPRVLAAVPCEHILEIAPGHGRCTQTSESQLNAKPTEAPAIIEPWRASRSAARPARGLSRAEGTGRWTDGHGVIHLAEPRADGTLSLQVAVYNPGGSRVRAAANGTLLAEMELPSGIHSRDRPGAFAHRADRAGLRHVRAGEAEPRAGRSHAGGLRGRPAPSLIAASAR